MWSSCTRWQNYWGIESPAGEPLLQLGSQRRTDVGVSATKPLAGN